MLRLGQEMFAMSLKQLVVPEVRKAQDENQPTKQKTPDVDGGTPKGKEATFKSSPRSRLGQPEQRNAVVLNCNPKYK